MLSLLKMPHYFIEVVQLIDVEYKGNKKSLFVEAKENSRILLGDEGGCFFSRPLSLKSRYDGFFWHSTTDNQLFKIIDSIELPEADESISDTIIEKRKVSLKHESIIENYFMPEDARALFLKLDAYEVVKPHFDVKKVFDNREWGRIYEYEVNGNIALIHFKKITDKREDESEGGKEFELFIAIAFSGSSKSIDEWKEMNYEYDMIRNSPPFKRYVYCPLSFWTDKIVIVPSRNRDYALKKAKKLFSKFDKLEQSLEQLPNYGLESPHLDFAYSLAERNMKILNVDNRFIMAGIPWFYDEWARDEAISLYWLLKEDKQKGLELAIRMLSQMINGKIKTNLNAKEGIFSIDAFPFIFKRIFDTFLSREGDYKINKKAPFKKKEMEKFIELSKRELDAILRYYLRDGLIHSNSNETWMDSVYQIDEREGFNIEIQAMIIYLAEKMNWLTSEKKYSEIATEIKNKTRQEFWNGSYLVDNLKNPWLRPNIFLAYYFCPTLLEEHQWRLCFTNAFDELWLDWGGFATISKKSKLFHSRHTGEDPASYHRGDSWYFMNNIAAIVLGHFDKKRYGKYIAKILSASTYDILFEHSIGYASELSDAEEQSSNGAFAQAFSASTYIELVDFLFSVDKNK